MQKEVCYFAYLWAVHEPPVLGPDGKYQVNRDKVILGRSIADDEIDFDSGFLMMPQAVPETPAAQPAGSFPVDNGAGRPPSVPEGADGIGVGTGTGPVTTGTDVAGRKKRIAFAFEATRDRSSRRSRPSRTWPTNPTEPGCESASRGPLLPVSIHPGCAMRWTNRSTRRISKGQRRNEASEH